ncbi:golgin subfamily A member 6-like protein 6 isoform X1 [Acropora muricata]|uniref:golgin subfamily A member 6-like protein 6 isoform X1 n=1 Tax=Acropora muricata TaxID=159855 RepID=UPI0034E37EE1
MNVPDFENLSPPEIANGINEALLEPLRQFQPLNREPDVYPLPLEVNPVFLEITPERVYGNLSHLNKHKAPGPDGLSNWCLKEYAELLYQPIADILNSSYKEQKLPSVWKYADVTPLPKVKQVVDPKKELRPISLTASLSKIAEDFVVSDYIRPALERIADSNQFEFQMQWTKAQDVLLCRQVLALEPYKHKKGSNEAGKIWTDIAQSLKECEHMNFKENLSQRAVRERVALLQCKFKEKEKQEIRASGISPEQDELDVLLEEIIERGKVAKENSNFASEKKEKDKASGEDIQRQALERIGQTKKRNSQDEGEWAVKETRKRRSGNDAVEFLKAKCDKEMVLCEKEIDLNRKEQQEKVRQFELMFEQQQAMLQAMQQQQAQQQQQNQSLHLMMAQQNKAIMSLIEKMVSKE